MSRLHKKKPTTEKKKKKTESENITATASGSASGVKATTVTSGKKIVPEKKAVEVSRGEPNIFQKAVEFVREVKVELKKVTWPTRKQTTGTTIIVIIFVFVVAAFLGLFDYSLSKLVQVVLT